MKKHPVVFGFLLLVVIGVFCFLILRAVIPFERKSASFSSKDKIGVVTIEGVLRNSKDIIEQLDKYEKDDKVKAVILRVDSPGGAVGPAQEIFDKILRLKQSKKVIVSMGSIAASGGYYVACAADRIIANPGTITGSIGVVIQFSQIDDLLKKIGLKTNVIKAGRYKDVGSPVRDMTADERKLIQVVIDDIHDQFVEVVVLHRNIPKEKMENIADARIFTGRQALTLGLVDELGNMEYAIDVASGLAGIKDEPEVVYPEKKRKSFLRYLTSEMITAISEEFRGNDTDVCYLYKLPGGI